MKNAALFLPALFFLIASGALAQEEASPNQGRIGVEGGMDVADDYYFRGIVQEKKELIAQPYMEVGIDLYESDEGTVRSVDGFVGTWSSIHHGRTGLDGPRASAGPEAWYEADFYFGVSIEVLEEWEFSVTYTTLTSPNGLWGSIHEIAFGAAYDDSAHWESAPGFLGVQPSVTLITELRGQADGAGPMGDEGTYLQIAVRPGLDLGQPPLEGYLGGVSVYVPTSLNFSVADYYEDSTGDDESFGYFDIGVEVEVPLTLVPADYGSWTLAVGLHYLLLGDTTEMINGGDDDAVVATVGVAMEY